MATALLDTGQVAVIAGVITANGTAPTISTRDGAIAVSATAAGDFVLTFNHTFNAAPVVTANVVSTFATTAIYTATVVSVSTATARINVVGIEALANATAANHVSLLVDKNVHFTVVGSRNR